jgi:hypothetical protein
MTRSLMLCITLLSATLAAQSVPPPVKLNINNILQDTEVWCWAAVAQQIILAKRGPQNTPQQCALVAIANNTHPNVCCLNYNPACIITGSIHQIQYLLKEVGGSYSTLQPPADAAVLYNTLRSGRPIILQVSTGQASAHVVVLTGMYYVRLPNGILEPMLYINDPLSYFSQSVPFRNILTIWTSAIVVEN